MSKYRSYHLLELMSLWVCILQLDSLRTFMEATILWTENKDSIYQTKEFIVSIITVPKNVSPSMRNKRINKNPCKINTQF